MLNALGKKRTAWSSLGQWEEIEFDWVSPGTSSEQQAAWACYRASPLRGCAMGGYAFLPEEVDLLSKIMTDLMNEVVAAQLSIPLFVMAQRLFHEAHATGFDDLERLKAVALGVDLGSTVMSKRPK